MTTALTTRQRTDLAADSLPADARAAGAHRASLAPGSRPVTMSRLAASARILWPSLAEASTAEAVGYAPLGNVVAAHMSALCRAAATDDNWARGLRDVAMLAVLLGGGLRRAEAAALTWADYDAEAGTVTVRHGKGNEAA